MMGVFRMPSLGADMEAGKLVQWLVKPGDTVRHGDVVAVVETQKGAIEIECFEDGTVASLDAALGQNLPVGAPLARIVAPGEKAGAQTPAPPARQATPEFATPPPQPTLPQSAPSARAPSQPAPSPPAVSGIAASPAARARAAELGLDLAQIRGTGPGGAVLLADLPAPSAMVAPKPDRAAILAEMRRAIAAAMARSKREIPHYYLTHTVDLEAATTWLARTNADRPPEARLLLGALLLKATALAAKAEPAMNGTYSEVEGFIPSAVVHVGLAIALRGGGLFAPAILNADTLALPDLMASMRGLTDRARAGRLRSSEMGAATITLSSLGETGVEAMAGIVIPPQVALLTAGSPLKMPLVRDGAVVARTAVTLTLSADHRVSDARSGSRFLTEIDRLLQTPEAL